MLVSLLLNKDYSKRPNIFEFSRIPCVHKAIRKFVEENNCRDEVLGIFDMDSGKQVSDSTDGNKDKDDDKDKNEEEEKLGKFQLE